MIDAAPRPEPTQDDLQRAMLDELAGIGMDIARTVNFIATAEAAKAQDAPGGVPARAALQCADAYDRAARAVRRTILLRRSLDDVRPKPAPKPEPEPASVQEARLLAISRRVENLIDNSDRTAREKEALIREFHERLELPECAEELVHRPIAELLLEILTDLGLQTPGGFRAKRRTPPEIAELHRRAAHLAARLTWSKPPPDPTPDPAPGPHPDPAR